MKNFQKFTSIYGWLALQLVQCQQEATRVDDEKENLPDLEERLKKKRIDPQKRSSGNI